MEYLLVRSPAAACAALMLACFRMMRHPEMPAGEPAAHHEVVALREEVTRLRDELARERPAPAGTRDDAEAVIA